MAEAAAPPPICADLATQIQQAEQELSAVQLEAAGDNSAPRAQMRAAQQTAQLERIQINIGLMRDHRCPAYPHAIGLHSFASAAAKCSMAISDRARSLEITNRETVGPIPECDRSNWQRR